MAKKDTILTVQKLNKSYNQLHVVKDVSFDVYENEVFGILGPNGAGKTTLLEMIEGLRTIDKGHVNILDIDIDKTPTRAKQIIGIQLQSSDYFDNLSLKEILELFGAFYSRKIDAGKLLEKVELKQKAKAMVRQLSGGQKQRMSIALSLVNDPRLLFLDEPTTGLDPQARRHMWEFIKELKKEGRTTILTTHYMEEAEQLCDRVAIMDEGKLITIDTPENLIEALLEKGFKKKQVVKQANLEDVFIDLTGKKLRD